MNPFKGCQLFKRSVKSVKRKKEFEELNGDYFKYQNKILNLNAATSHNLVAVLRNIAFTGVIWYFGGASLSATGIISLGGTVCVRRLFNTIILANYEYGEPACKLRASARCIRTCL